jgi:hypothetical protein
MEKEGRETDNGSRPEAKGRIPRENEFTIKKNFYKIKNKK